MTPLPVAHSTVIAREHIEIRRAEPADAPAIAAIHRSALRRALPHLPVLHSPDEELEFFRDRVLARCEVWVETASDGTVAGFCGLSEGWIEHFYVAPSHQGRGVGGRLLRHAMARQPSLRLWTFQRNARARRFYERHGFLAVKETDGRGNEEREPDVLYAWSRHGDAASARTGSNAGM